ncbi:MAG: flavin reductase family protein [Defluviitoga tunisiensis]|jgi:flavin reductase (DIM6/NTAB) family NADH-FMN oxidoreductase RutF|uniref:Flavin reductase like protein n=1 Tax=Defluviitoga tunisiensis TaxID=1006576 RepID=A0A0C7NVS5_DEFTU|nr:flavin reductase family protein [Defluviitoga tunisiensis]MDD3600510.1 flavin reductase family protein [Defluviitoga tunisiensis]MDY0379439.1 flavin reductase family protein [Defluviitoga tunisiensis]CEP77588.1 Flavin reductase like protein [Defluviitoga tunisiensis]HHV01874.1 flavin reductase family protein [Defluviitoga tunisiensis]HOB55664.1 flavin reductase family protein [Defluviitoga tunisiensis]
MDYCNRFSENISLPVCLITVKSESRVNSMTVAWSTPLSSNPPLFGFAIRKNRFTYQLIVKEKEFTVSFLSLEKSDLAVKLGRISGREGDKVSAISLKLKDSDVVKTPYVEEAYFAMECKLENLFETGDHDFVVGRVVSVHPTKNVLIDSKPAIYLGNDTFTTIDTSQINKFDTKEIVASIKNSFGRGA